MDEYIGKKKIKSIIVANEKTQGGQDVVLIEYEDGLMERIPTVMFDEIVSDEPCGLDELRDKRIRPVVSLILTLLQEWGIKLSELGYLSALLNQSLDFNRDSALRKLWSKYMPEPLAPDEVDLLTVNRVLRESDTNKE